jgi:hypothetical protein
VARLKNWRRLTPIASGSGGTITAGAMSSALTSDVLSARRGPLDLATGGPDRQVDLGVAVAALGLALTAHRRRARRCASDGEEDDRAEDDDGRDDDGDDSS